MPNILSKLNDNSDNSKLRFVSILVVVSIVFGLVGYLLVILFAPSPNELSLEQQRNVTISNNQNPQADETSYEGFVRYVDPNFYPNENISFVLENSAGEEVILLKADDQKLEVAEGHYVTARGNVEKSDFGDFNYLMVDEVTIQNNAN